MLFSDGGSENNGKGAPSQVEPGAARWVTNNSLFGQGNSEHLHVMHLSEIQTESWEAIADNGFG